MPGAPAEIAKRAKFGIRLDETSTPSKGEAPGVCEIAEMPLGNQSSRIFDIAGNEITILVSAGQTPH